jgi:hypothetical protein
MADEPVITSTTTSVPPASIAEAAALNRASAAEAKSAEYQRQLELVAKEKTSALDTASAEVAKYRMQAAKEKLRNEAIRAGIVNASLVDHLPVELAFATDGSLTGVAETIAKWKTTTPEIFKTETAAPVAVAAAAGALATSAVRVPSAAAAPVISTNDQPPAMNAMDIPRGKAGRDAYRKFKAEVLAESHKIAGDLQH